MPQVKVKNPGDCYCGAFQILLDRPDAVLVHGFPRCTGGKYRGKRMGHAWVEVTLCGLEFVIGHTNPDRMIPAALYYHIGQIDPAECKRYTLRTAMQMANKHGTYGAWGKQPDDVYFAELSE